MPVLLNESGKFRLGWGFLEHYYNARSTAERINTTPSPKPIKVGAPKPASGKFTAVVGVTADEVGFTVTVGVIVPVGLTVVVGVLVGTFVGVAVGCFVGVTVGFV